jgi:hypothetical protein
MEKKRTDLRTYSILILAFAILSLARMIADACMNGFGNVGTLPEGVSEEAGKVALVVVWVIGILFLLPQVYVGLAGLKQSKEPTKGRAYITWSLIIAAFSALAVISGIVEITKVYTLDTLIATLDALVNVILFAAFYFTARQISAEA